jgi:hypothetical protein
MEQLLAYDPAGRGPYPVGVVTIEATDHVRERMFPCEIWYPSIARHAGEDLSPATQDKFTIADGERPRAQAAVRDALAEPGRYPLIVYSHHSRGHRRAASFLCTHLARFVVTRTNRDHPAHPLGSGENPGAARARLPDLPSAPRGRFSPPYRHHAQQQRHQLLPQSGLGLLQASGIYSISALHL